MDDPQAPPMPAELAPVPPAPAAPPRPAAARWWTRAWCWCRDRLPARHRHHYAPIAVSYWAPSAAAAFGAAPPSGRTTVVMRCFCSRADQYAWVVIPARLTLAEVQRQPWPELAG